MTERSEIIAKLELALGRIKGGFTNADVANKVLEVHPDLDKNDVNAAVEAVVSFRDVDFEWKELGKEALRCQQDGRRLLWQGLAALDRGDIEQGWELKARGDAKYAEAERLQAKYEQMYVQKKREVQQIRELFAAHPECKTLGDLKNGTLFEKEEPHDPRKRPNRSHR